MSFRLLHNAGAGVTSSSVPARPDRCDHLPSRFTANGSYDTAIILEASPTVDENDWYTLSTLAPGGAYYDLLGPVERIRARTPVGMGGTANVYWTPGD